MNFHVEFDREHDGRWIAEISKLPGVMVYGTTRLEVESKVHALALEITADRSDQTQILSDVRSAIQAANPEHRDLVAELIHERRLEAQRDWPSIL